ncbi:MAG: hypothetical protein OXC26_01000, partial [Albidovulum sp.]|nr:hypothetical protein [Albidovulum sp.]
MPVSFYQAAASGASPFAGGRYLHALAGSDVSLRSLRDADGCLRALRPRQHLLRDGVQLAGPARESSRRESPL